MQEAATVPKYGEFNVWDLYDPDAAREIPCARAEMFFHLLYSESTHGARIEEQNTAQGFADFVLYGPVTDDAVDGDGARKLTKLEVDGETRYVGFESMTCLTATFRLYKWQVYTKFPEPEDRDNLLARITELGITGKPLEQLCHTLELRRVQ